MQVLSVAAEAYPLVKTGGLGDVVGALPGALSGHGIMVTTLMPGYPAVRAHIGDAPLVHHYPNLMGTEARIRASYINGFPLLVLDAPALFQRDGGPYGDRTGADWPDNWRRFAALGRAAADLASGAIPNWRFDLLHAHDWHAGLAPAYLRYAPGPSPAASSLLTIHNIAFQGRFDVSIFPFLGLPPRAYAIDGVEYYGGVGFLKAGLAGAQAITTVSPGYAREIREPAFGMGMEGLIRSRGGDVSGILNGIDPKIWNPQSDAALAARYDSHSLNMRRANKRAIESGFGLTQGDGPLFTVISRLSWQKGMDILAEQLDTLVALGGRLALLGTGEVALEAKFRAAASRHPGRIAVALGYDEKLSHLLQGGADAILIPSRFEPCGLTQLYGLAYGCVPVAARTGGLSDTIIDANEAALAQGVATGILFDSVTNEGVAHALQRAVSLYTSRDAWCRMQVQGMAADFSWHQSGARYAELYAKLTRPPA
ncbi:MAG TPA: glycogen synthase GlgA [Rhizomicrobium sp.]|nr:glycogen synthase GlgA [Rhizomicrobium sp.]